MKQPDRFGLRAKALWDGVLSEAELDSAGLTLLEDACRTADIIDRLSEALSSKNQEWLRLAEEAEFLSDGAAEIHLVINPILGEIRQQRLALRQLLAQLKLGNIKPKAPKDENKGLFDFLESEFPA